MATLENMAGIKKANDNIRLMADPEGGQKRLMNHLEGVVCTAVGDTVRNIMLTCVHTDYATPDVFLAVTRGTLQYAMGMISALPDDHCRKVLEELAAMNDYVVSTKTKVGE